MNQPTLEKSLHQEIKKGHSWAKAYGRLEGTLKSIVQLIDSGLIRDLTTVNELIESRLRKEQKEIKSIIQLITEGDYKQ